jgi:ABC-2 type transport system ATP-binding protein
MRVRRMIGLAGQYAAVDENLTGRENLTMVGRLNHLARDVVARRATELLASFDLSDAGDRPLKTYSGGMRRRLDVAAALVAQPKVLFLDEPTSGLDPQSRIDLWEMIEVLVDGGTSVLLTTQYLEEADALADKIVLIDHGQSVATGTSSELKARIGDQRVDIVAANADDLEKLERAFDGLFDAVVSRERRTVSIPAPSGIDVLTAVTNAVRDSGVIADEVALRRPTLDDAFFALTGQGHHGDIQHDLDLEGAK